MLSDELGVAVGDEGRGVDVLVEDGDCARVGVVQRPGTDADGIQRDPATAYLPLPASQLRTPWRGGGRPSLWPWLSYGLHSLVDEYIPVTS